MTQTMIQMKSKIASPSSEKVAHERLLYDSGLTPVLEISTLLGVNAHQFHAYRVQNGRSLCPKLCQPAAGSEIKAATANAPVNSPRNDDNVRQISPERQSHRRGASSALLAGAGGAGGFPGGGRSGGGRSGGGALRNGRSGGADEAGGAGLTIILILF